MSPVGSEPSWSAVLTRTNKGEELLEGGRAKGYVEVTEKVDVRKIERLTKIKRGQAEQQQHKS